MPEVLWKSYIDFEIEQKETERARQLYERLLQRTNHVKVILEFRHVVSVQSYVLYRFGSVSRSLNSPPVTMLFCGLVVSSKGRCVLCRAKMRKKRSAYCCLKPGWISRYLVASNGCTAEYQITCRMWLTWVRATSHEKLTLPFKRKLEVWMHGRLQHV